MLTNLKGMDKKLAVIYLLVYFLVVFALNLVLGLFIHSSTLVVVLAVFIIGEAKPIMDKFAENLKK